MVSLTGLSLGISDCQRSILTNWYQETPLINLEYEAVTLKLRPLNSFSNNQDIGLRLSVFLQDREEANLYSLEIDTQTYANEGEMIVNLTRLDDGKEIAKVL